MCMQLSSRTTARPEIFVLHHRPDWQPLYPRASLGWWYAVATMADALNSTYERPAFRYGEFSISVNSQRTVLSCNDSNPIQKCAVAGGLS